MPNGLFIAASRRYTVNNVCAGRCSADAPALTDTIFNINVRQQVCGLTAINYVCSLLQSDEQAIRNWSPRIDVRFPKSLQYRQVCQLTPMDRVTLPHAQSAVALYTEPDAECDHWATIVSRLKTIGRVHRRCQMFLTRRPATATLSAVAGADRVINRDPPSTALLTALKDGRPVLAKFFKVQNCACKSELREPYCAPFRGDLSSEC